MDRSAKYLKNLVGAPGFEPGASCAQGRRATRLRYAPTVAVQYRFYCTFALSSIGRALTLRERCWIAADFSHSAQSSGFRVAESGAFRRSGRSNCRRWTSASESRALLYLTCATLMLE